MVTTMRKTDQQPVTEKSTMKNPTKAAVSTMQPTPMKSTIETTVSTAHPTPKQPSTSQMKISMSTMQPATTMQPTPPKPVKSTIKMTVSTAQPTPKQQASSPVQQTGFIRFAG